MDRCRRDLCNWLLDNTCNLFLFIIVFGALVTMLYVSIKISEQVTHSTATSVQVTTLTDPKQHYSMCYATFSDANKNVSLNVMDMMFLAQAAYEMDYFNLTELIGEYFDDKFNITYRNFKTPTFFHMRSKVGLLDIVAIRGTKTVLDVIQDIGLFIEVVTFQTLGAIFPFLTYLPTTFIQDILYYCSLVEGLINADVRQGFDAPIQKYITDHIISRNDNTTIFILGHSLGGGIAEIVAAKLYSVSTINVITSFGMCSPGVLYSAAKFGFTMDALDLTSQSLLPRRDLVSVIDMHGGNIQNVECYASQVYQCHLVQTVLCELYHTCPTTNFTHKSIFDCYCYNSTYDYKFSNCMNVTTCNQC